MRDKQRFDSWWDDDGIVHLRACLDAETGPAFLAGVESLVERTARRERAAAKKAPPTGDAPGESAAVPAEPGEPSRPGVASAEPAEPCDVPAGTHPSPLDQDDELALARERTTARRCATLAQLATAAADADRRAGDPPRREVVIHVDAAVLADDTAAGVAHLDGGPALHPATVRRMLCEATVVTMLSNGREPLALGRARRFATRAQRRALYRRDRGCARPGCPETRPERLHAHHLRHWLFGGRTDVSNMALLCDTDHGLAHDLDLVLSRRDGQLIALTPDGQRIWGPPDAAFTTGLTALVDHPAAPGHPDGTGHPDGVRPAPGDPFVGVHPIDRLRARRPDVPAETSPVPPTPDARAGTPGAGAVTGGATISELLTPGTAPEVPDALHVNGEPMDLEYVVWALLAHRDLARRLAAEGAVENRTAAA